MSEWKPIDTAPKDGTIILVIDDEGMYDLAHWNRDVKAFVPTYLPRSFPPFSSLAFWAELPLPPIAKKERN